MAETVKSRHSHRTLSTWREAKSYKGGIGLLQWKKNRVDICLLCNSQHQIKDTIIDIYSIKKWNKKRGARGRRVEGGRGGEGEEERGKGKE